MKILAIGNSFSEDAAYYVYKIAKSAGINDLKFVNLYIGGISIKNHADNIRQNNSTYRYDLNGVHTDRYVSIGEALKEDKWDIVTLQQQSSSTGIYESFGQDFEFLISTVKKLAPNAKIYFYQTWAYEIDSKNGNFPLFNNDQTLMHKSIVETVKRVCNESALPVIPCGEVIDLVRKQPLFDYANGGESLCRDGYHMSLTYGRFALGVTFFGKLIGNIDDITFVPENQDIVNGYSVPEFECSEEKIRLIKDCAKTILNR